MKKALLMIALAGVALIAFVLTRLGSESASVGIIGGMDGPTVLYLFGKNRRNLA